MDPSITWVPQCLLRVVCVAVVNCSRVLPRGFEAIGLGDAVPSIGIVSSLVLPGTTVGVSFSG